MSRREDGPPLSSTGIVYKGSHRRFAEREAYLKQERRDYDARHPEIQAARDEEAREEARKEREKKARQEALERAKREGII